MQLYPMPAGRARRGLRVDRGGTDGPGSGRSRTEVGFPRARRVPYHPQVCDDQLAALAVVPLRVLHRVHRVDLELTLAGLQ